MHWTSTRHIVSALFLFLVASFFFKCTKRYDFAARHDYRRQRVVSCPNAEVNSRESGNFRKPDNSLGREWFLSVSRSAAVHVHPDRKRTRGLLRSGRLAWRSRFRLPRPAMSSCRLPPVQLRWK